jgi:hypothetical protein
VRAHQHGNNRGSSVPGAPTDPSVVTHLNAASVGMPAKPDRLIHPSHPLQSLACSTILRRHGLARLPRQRAMRRSTMTVAGSGTTA